MIDRRGLLALGACAAALWLAHELTRAPGNELADAIPPAPAVVTLRPPLSTTHVGLPVDLTRVARRVEIALAERLAVGLDRADPSCGRRAAVVGECSGLGLDGPVALASPVEAGIVDGLVRVRLPLRLTVGQGNDLATIETSLSFVFRVEGEPGGGFEIARIEEPAEGVDGRDGRTIRLLEARLRPLALTALDELRSVLGGLPVGAAAQSAWAALSQPIELGTGSGRWLKVSPEVVGAGALASSDGRPMLHIPIASRITIEAGPQSPAPRRTIVYGQVRTTGGAVVRIATPLPLAGLQAAIDAALVKSDPHVLQPDRFGPPLHLLIRQARLRPSVRQLALELDVAATQGEGETVRGKTHLVGRVVLDVEQRLVTLADIAFPHAPSHDTARTALPRIPAESFAARLAQIARLDVAADVAEARPRTSQLLNRRLDGYLALSARLDAATPVSVEVTRDGLWLLTDVRGTLTARYESQGSGELDITATKVSERPVEAAATTQARRLATPELTAAAVVRATTGAGGAQSTAKGAGSAAPPAANLTVVTPTTGTPPPLAAPAPASIANRAAPATPPPGRSRVARTTPPRTPAAGGKAGNRTAAAPRPEWVRSVFSN